MTRTEILEVAKPILFSTPMVEAILDERKNQTRRIVTPPKWSTGTQDDFFLDLHGNLVTTCASTGCDARIIPKYKRGDFLWVRETWNGDWCDHYIYRADGGSARAAGYQAEPKWRPSIFMPKEAARFFLRVLDVYPQRLREITHSQRIAEGIKKCHHKIASDNLYCGCSLSAFIDLWDSINGKRGFGWKVNPWVWVIEFEKVQITH